VLILVVLIFYVLPVYLVFFRFRLIEFTRFWKVVTAVPSVAGLLFLWFALGRYTPQTQDAYVQAPVIQIAPEVNGLVTDVLVADNQEVKQGTALFVVDPQPYQYQADQARAALAEAHQTVANYAASLAAANESVRRAQAMLLAAGQKIEAFRAGLAAAKANVTKVKAQLDYAETDFARQKDLFAKNSASRVEYDLASTNATVLRATFAEAQQTQSRAEAALAGGFQEAEAAEAALIEAHALRKKAEVLVDPVRATRDAIRRHGAADRTDRTASQPTTSAPTGEGTLAGSLWDDPLADATFLQRMLNDLEQADQVLAGEYAIVRKAKEALKQAEFQLSRTRVCAPIDGAISNLQLTKGTYAKSGTPVISLVAGQRWRVVANIPENWLERVRPGDRAEVSLRNYPLRIRTGTVEAVSRGVMQGQAMPSGTLPDTNPRMPRQTDTPDDEQRFQVSVALADDRPGEPLRVGATGRATIYADGGMPVVNQLSAIIHRVFSFMDYFFPKPSALLIVAVVFIALGFDYWRNTRKQRRMDEQRSR
jgi:multidrug resistance efflux pump